MVRPESRRVEIMLHGNARQACDPNKLRSRFRRSQKRTTLPPSGISTARPPQLWPLFRRCCRLTGDRYSKMTLLQARIRHLPVLLGSGYVLAVSYELREFEELLVNEECGKPSLRQVPIDEGDRYVVFDLHRLRLLDGLQSMGKVASGSRRNVRSRPRWGVRSSSGADPPPGAVRNSESVLC